MRGTRFFLPWLAAAALLIPGTAAGAEIFGTYNNGCIRGAVRIPQSPYYPNQRWGPGRDYAHPEMISYLEDLVKKAREHKLPPLLLGDASKRYGGPFGKGSSHGSHNIGLDADISFDFSSPKKSDAELSHPKDVYIVDTKGNPTANFDSNRAALIYLAADDPRVQRIFVAPGIKRALCRMYKRDGYSTSWLHKLRPWYGHRGHMHVRLYCPDDSPECKVQAEAPEGDGCGAELDSWFQPPKPPKPGEKPKPPKPKVLPEQCRAVLQGK